MNHLNLRRARKRNSALAPIKQRTPERGWKKRATRAVSIGKPLVFGLGFTLGFAFDALNIPKAVVAYKANIVEAREFVSSHLYKHSNWVGTFDKYPEGIVNMNDLGIVSPVKAALEIEVRDGNLLDGRVWWDGSCELGSFYTGPLIEDKIRLGGSIATVIVYDFYRGSRVDYFEGQLTSDGLMVEFSNFPAEHRLNGTRIIKNPEPATLEDWADLYCFSLNN